MSPKFTAGGCWGTCVAKALTTTSMVDKMCAAWNLPLVETGVGERMKREAMVHEGIFLGFNGAAHKLDFQKLVGKRVYI